MSDQLVVALFIYLLLAKLIGLSGASPAAQRLMQIILAVVSIVWLLVYYGLPPIKL